MRSEGGIPDHDTTRTPHSPLNGVRDEAVRVVPHTSAPISVDRRAEEPELAHVLSGACRVMVVVMGVVGRSRPLHTHTHYTY